MLVALFVTVVLNNIYCPLDSENPGIVAVFAAVAAAVVQRAKPDSVVLLFDQGTFTTNWPLLFVWIA